MNKGNRKEAVCVWQSLTTADNNKKKEETQVDTARGVGVGISSCVAWMCYLFVIDIQQTESVGETGALLPAGNDDDGITGADEITRFAKVNTKLDAVVDVLQPVFYAASCFFTWQKVKTNLEDLAII